VNDDISGDSETLWGGCFSSKKFLQSHLHDGYRRGYYWCVLQNSKRNSDSTSGRCSNWPEKCLEKAKKQIYQGLGESQDEVLGDTQEDTLCESLYGTLGDTPGDSLGES